MKRFFLGWTRFVIALLVLQVGLAGWGAVSAGGERIMRFIAHAGNGGMLMFWLMLSVVFALIARPGWKAVLLTALSAFMIMMQGAFAYGFGADGVGGGVGIALHALNGLGILVVQTAVARLAKRAVDAKRALKAAGNEVPA
ncbi:hypothetical protein K3N28_14235 [Glycomyces sp. TRM65418]|uniref:hypothetical protein n=1 Tax=Glycomyces sp. TRM65418 TaxID=2867006 RepID=UPI001CE66F42|nr:hypothetical protein [Glycomyces sp. TRM65418]MCC3764223.1 hypothetical protein [Glycomyces sp. TRM65418]QZD53906.1 hypothetical protein K3N28_14170 [Glycomyces sp. TRM65418]